MEPVATPGARTTTSPPTDRENGALPPLARLPVFGIAGLVTVLLFALSGRIGYFGDELYFLASGKYHLDWGYADNPWLLPVMARAMDAVFPGSVMGLRLPAALLTGAGVILAALIAREFGGERKAQALAAGAYAISLQLLGSGHILATSTVDPFLWTLVSWLVVRWVRTRADRLLLFAGLATAIAMQGKFLIMFFWAALAVVALVIGPRDLLRRPALWAAGAITVLATVPTLLWQARNGWPYFEMQAVVAEQVNRFLGGPAAFVPLAVLFAGLLVGAFLACHGVWHLVRAREFAEYRFLGWTIIVLCLLFVLTSGRYYYVAGLYGLVFAVSAVRIERHGTARWWRWVPTLPVYLVSALIAIPLTLPVFPVSWVNTTQFTASGSLGWPEVAGTVVNAYRALPPPMRERAAVVTETYWQASALDVFGREQGLPEVYGTERGYWYTARPPEGTGPVLYVGGDAAYLGTFFDDVRQVGVTRLDANPDNVNQGVRVWLCDGPRAPWSQLWPRMHRA